MKLFLEPLWKPCTLIAMTVICLSFILPPIPAGAGESRVENQMLLAKASIPGDTAATIAARKTMVTEQILDRNITDKRVLDAMNNVPRHLFVPTNRADDAYKDYPVAIGFGQTISQPYMVAFMSQIAEIHPNEKVLEVGSGSGYHGSIMAKCAKEVFSIEIVPALAERSKQTVEDLGYANLTIRQGDGYFGWPEKGPFDAIVVTAASEHVPPPLVQQLAEGGRMIIPVGHPFVTQMLVMVEKKNGKISSRELMPVNFVPLTGSRPG